MHGNNLNKNKTSVSMPRERPPRSRSSLVKQRAKQIRKANKPKATTKDYLQIAMVILIIFVILGGALYLTQNF